MALVFGTVESNPALSADVGTFDVLFIGIDHCSTSSAFNEIEELKLNGINELKYILENEL